ncbi:MAG TPA: SRPBCC family protein [Flavobacteriaceae bacterium]|nr:SRPBCC family protein [Flavobacteriaceae bacterium]HEX5742512.1 SRPBCC family protein [Flavobacteriaceae bacterium]
MKILKYVLFLLLIAFVGGSLYLATLNGNYDVKRTRIIKAPVEVVFDAVNDYRTWQHWGPWNETDSTLIYTFPEKTVGVGATYSWKGTSGDGSMENLVVVPNVSIDDVVHFEGQGDAFGYWRFIKVPDGVEITWGIKGEMPFVARFMAAKMEDEIGPMLERGLELLDTYLQKNMKEFSIESVGAVDYSGGYYLYQTTSCRFDEIESKMNEITSNLNDFIKLNQIEATGKSFTIIHKWDDIMQTAMLSSCIPIKERLITTDKTVMVGMMEPQRVFKTILKGDYSNLFTAWETAYKNLAVQGFVTKLNAKPFEVYVTKKNEVPNPANWITEIYIPIE